MHLRRTDRAIGVLATWCELGVRFLTKSNRVSGCAENLKIAFAWMNWDLGCEAKFVCPIKCMQINQPLRLLVDGEPESAGH